MNLGVLIFYTYNYIWKPCKPKPADSLKINIDIYLTIHGAIYSNYKTYEFKLFKNKSITDTSRFNLLN